MDVIDSNYIEMFPITTRNDEEINKSFDSLNDHNYYDFNFDINKRDENGNSILHRIIINSLNEQELLLKIEFIPKIETLINDISELKIPSRVKNTQISMATKILNKIKELKSVEKFGSDLNELN